MNRRLYLSFRRAIGAVVALGLGAATQAADLNVADPAKHPYADPTSSREGHLHTNETANEARLYDFYQRQADYYLAHPDQVPEVVPAFPGLDAGLHGHWGKHNQNGHKDGRWATEMGQSHIVGQQVESIVSDAVAVRLSDKHEISAAFSARANLNFFRYWSGDFVGFTAGRWGSTGGMVTGKPVHFELPKTAIAAVGELRLGKKLKGPPPSPVGWQVPLDQQTYHGFYDCDAGAIFSYAVAGKSVLDHLSAAGKDVYRRTMTFENGTPGALVALFEGDKSALVVGKGTVGGKTAAGSTWLAHLSGTATASIEKEGSTIFLRLKESNKSAALRLIFSIDKGAVADGLKAAAATSPLDLLALRDKRSIRWPETLQTKGQLGKNDKAYVVDEIQPPFENANKSLMFFTSLTFDDKGAAYLTTLMGELWKVTGIDQSLKKLTWRKMASGLNQPFGIQIRKGKFVVLERAQISILEDRNNDGEIDFFGCFSNAFGEPSGSHTHSFGLEDDPEGNWYFTVRSNCIKVSADGKKAEVVSSGVRNCMGVGKAADGTILVGPQEGTATPTSAVIEYRAGANYGLRDDSTPPLCYVPRGTDNSTGGFLGVTSDKWGPLGRDGLIGLSYGYSTWYHILFDENADATKTRQMATVPMPGEFLSGVTRGAVNPVDGQVYAVGLDGWGDYSVKDGCFSRLRHTGKALHAPVGYRTYDNGFLVRFAFELDADAVADPGKYFAQVWDYRITGQYGSPEYSVAKPDTLGHDPLKVHSARLLPDGKSIFVEIPDLRPAMQAYLRMQLTAKDGTAFKADLFPTIVELGDRREFPGAAPNVAEKDRKFKLKIVRTKGGGAKVTRSGDRDDHARTITVKTIPGLKYNRTSIKVKAGESLALKLMNIDQMPHNLVITKPGKKQAVGEAAFRMLNDPKAIDKHYVPDDQSDIVAYTYVVPPKGQHITYFTAPEKTGTYPFICTFPGHWQVMQGELVVK